MKKLIIVLAAGMIAAEGLAQNTQKIAPPPPPPPQQVMSMQMAPPPPAPPEVVNFTPPTIVKSAPPPPKPPMASKVKFTSPVIINNKGYGILVQATKTEPIILVTKKGLTQKIRMSVWNAKPAYFENKYGQLPSPPPPAPPAPTILSEKE